ncbi:MAG: DinB family protein [Bacteroidota bacterium]
MMLIKECVSCLSTAHAYLQILTVEEYQRPLDLLSSASIGQHTRHFIEFFQCLLQQLPSGEVNYDLRIRDQQIEQDPQFALLAIEKICQQLENCDLQQQIQLSACYSETVAVGSNVARELVYNLEHTIHHLAIIRIGLAILRPDLELPKSFGIAASTTKYRQGQLSASNYTDVEEVRESEPSSSTVYTDRSGKGFAQTTSRHV